MNPGFGKVHRVCAANCILGGIPPVFVSNDPIGQTVYFLLQGTDGRSVNAEVVPLIADPLEISGEVLQFDNLLVMIADPATYRRIFR